MDGIKYHPLVDANTDGTEKVPMFVTTEEKNVKGRYNLYLEEIVPHCYRLRGYKARADACVNIHCPNCGTVMKLLTPAAVNDRLYACPHCR